MDNNNTKDNPTENETTNPTKKNETQVTKRMYRSTSRKKKKIKNQFHPKPLKN